MNQSAKGTITTRRRSRLGDWIVTIHTLMVREVRVRFSADPVGYLWAYLTPMAWLASLAVIFSLIGRHPPVSADMVSFLIAGILPYAVFRMTITAMMRSIRTHRYMTYFPGIGGRDILIACAIMEFLNMLVVCAILITANLLVFGKLELHDPLLGLAGFALSWLLGASLGYILAKIAIDFDAAYRIVPMMLRPMFWISGIFFVANELPGYVHTLLQYNPLLQTIELTRSGLFSAYTHHQNAPIIPLFAIIGLLLSGICYRPGSRLGARKGLWR